MPSRKLNELAKAIHENAVNHGFIADKERRPIHLHAALIHSEVTELFEEWRANKPFEYYRESDNKPEGIASEAIDIIIRVLDFLYEYDINVDRMMEIKMNFNLGREYKHGKIA